MKNVFFALLLLSQVIIAQNSQKIIGKWAYVDLADKSQIDEVGKEMAEKMFASLQLDFRTDGTMSFSMMGKSEGGTYAFDKADEMQIQSKSDNGKPMNMVISKLTDTDLVIKLGTLGPLVMKKASAVPDAAPPAPVKVSTTKKQITGKWFLVDKESDKKKSEMFYELIEGSFLEFGADSKYNAVVIGVGENGTWKLGKDNQSVIVTTEDGEAEWFITAVSDTDLTMQKGPQAKKHIFSRTPRK